jgi:hypothetical protein
VRAVAGREEETMTTPIRLGTRRARAAPALLLLVGMAAPIAGDGSAAESSVAR